MNIPRFVEGDLLISKWCGAWRLVFDIEHGIKQGDIFAPMFFNAALGWLSGRPHLESESNHRNCSIHICCECNEIYSRAKVQPFSKILPIHCGPSAVHWLDTRMAWNFAHLEWTSSTLCSRREDWELVANVLWFVLETGISCCSTPHSPLDTKSFALATRGAKATRTSKTVLGKQIGDVLSLPSHWEVAAQNCEFWKQILVRF